MPTTRSFQRSFHFLLASAALLAAPVLHAQFTTDDLSGGKVSPVQTTAAPMKLSIAGPVMLAGSDANSKTVLADMPSILKTVNTKLAEYVKASDASMLLDPKLLTLANDSLVRIYFVGEGASFHNSLGFNTTGGNLKTPGSELIFPDASSRLLMTQTNPSVKRLASDPLMAGDFVNLGAFKAGTELDFFLIANGANGGTQSFSTEKAYNSDRINHVVSFLTKVSSSTYLILGFEDVVGGGDRDFNDMVFTLAISPIIAAPEPSLWALMAGLVGLAIWMKRRQNPLVSTLS